jgi:hypothetical protein
MNSSRKYDSIGAKNKESGEMDNIGNGHPNGKTYLTFGDPGHEVELSSDHASRVLGLLWERHRAQLAALIGEAYTGERPTASRTPRKAG